MKEFIAAGVQISPIPMDVEGNINKALKWLQEAAKTGAKLVAFPESATTGFAPGVPAAQLYEAMDVIPGRTTKALQEAARDLALHVVWTSYERGETSDIIYNSSILIDDQGRCAGVYRKTHPFPTERLANGGWTTPGNRADVFTTSLGRMGMIICYDGDFPELSRVLAIKGAEIIVRPSALLRSFEIWELTSCARAYDNHVYMIAVNAVGKDGGGNYYFGHSMIVSPIARKLALARGGEEILYALLDPNPVRSISYGVTSPEPFNHLLDRNLAVYGDVLKPAATFPPTP
jgi:predicted amidohydrolase